MVNINSVTGIIESAHRVAANAIERYTAQGVDPVKEQELYASAACSEFINIIQNQNHDEIDREHLIGKASEVLLSILALFSTIDETDGIIYDTVNAKCKRTVDMKIAAK